MLKIGEFARLVSVSVKTLRFYDAVGLFSPGSVDSRSGYRYYRTQQLAEFRRIQLLRALGFSIRELKQWTASSAEPAERSALLEELRERVRSRMACDGERLRVLDLWIDGLTRGNSSALAPTERAVAAVPAFTIRDRVRSIAPNVYRMFEAAEQTIARHGVRSARSPFLLFHDGEYRQTHADVEVCVPVRGSAVRAVGGRLVAGFRRVACLRFSGTYDQGPFVYDVIRRWMDSAGAQKTGPIREAYLRFGADQIGYALPDRLLTRQVAQYRTELQVPFS